MNCWWNESCTVQTHPKAFFQLQGKTDERRSFPWQCVMRCTRPLQVNTFPWFSIKTARPIAPNFLMIVEPKSFEFSLAMWCIRCWTRFLKSGSTFSSKSKQIVLEFPRQFTFILHLCCKNFPLLWTRVVESCPGWHSAGVQEWSPVLAASAHSHDIQTRLLGVLQEIALSWGTRVSLSSSRLMFLFSAPNQ